MVEYRFFFIGMLRSVQSKDYIKVGYTVIGKGSFCHPIKFSLAAIEKGIELCRLRAHQTGQPFEQMMVSKKPFKKAYIQLFSSARVRSGSHKFGPLFLQTIRFFLHHFGHAFPGTLSPRFAQNSDHSGTGNGPNCVQLDDTIPLRSDSVIDRNAIGG